jgi:hypothetical protein
MRTYLLAAACLALASCAAQKALPHYTEAEKQAQRESISYWKPTPVPADTAHHERPRLLVRVPVAAPDSLPYIEVSRKPTFIDKLFRHTPKTSIYPGALPVKAGKKSVINIYKGPANITTTNTGKKGRSIVGEGASNTEAGKKSGPIIKADSGAHVNTLTGPGNIQATNGNNNAPQLSAPVQQAADWRAVLAKPAGAVGAGVLSLVLVGGCIYLIAAYKRRKAAQV